VQIKHITAVVSSGSEIMTNTVLYTEQTITHQWIFLHLYPLTTEVCSKVVFDFWNHIRINIEWIGARCKTPRHRWLRYIILLLPKICHNFTQKQTGNCYMGIILQHKINPKKLKPGLVTSYNLRPGNGMGLSWKKYMDKSGSKQVRK